MGKKQDLERLEKKQSSFGEKGKKGSFSIELSFFPGAGEKRGNIVYGRTCMRGGA